MNGYSPVTPCGHESITALSAFGLTLYVPYGELKELSLVDMKAKTGCDVLAPWPGAYGCYGTRSPAVFSAVVGQRWVDIMGLQIGYDKLLYAGSTRCFDTVAQQSEAVQYDHFLRLVKDEGEAGRVTAIKGAWDRFATLFATAVATPEETMTVTDGGVGPAQWKVNRSYFLFGRALHLFQDSFSPEHAVRRHATDKDRGATSVVQDIKTYVCTNGAAPHTHEINSFVGGFGNWDTHGDIVWNAVAPLGHTDYAAAAARSDKSRHTAFLSELGNVRTGAKVKAATFESASAKGAYLATLKLWKYFIEAKRKPSTVSQVLAKIREAYFQIDADYRTPASLGMKCGKKDQSAQLAVELQRTLCLGKINAELGTTYKRKVTPITEPPYDMPLPINDVLNKTAK